MRASAQLRIENIMSKYAIVSGLIILAGCFSHLESRTYKVEKWFFIPYSEQINSSDEDPGELDGSTEPSLYKTHDECLRYVLKDMGIDFPKGCYFLVKTNECLIEFRHTSEKCDVMDQLMTPLTAK